MLSFLKGHPFAVYGVITLGLFTIVGILSPEYDGGTVGALLLLSSAIWGFIYWAPHELLYGLNGGSRFEGQVLLSVVIGFSACLLADYLLIGRRKKSASKKDHGNA